MSIENTEAVAEIPAIPETPPVKPKARLGILLSGRGSNFQAIASAILSGLLDNAQIVAVIGNKKDAPGLEYAQEAGFPAIFVDPKGFASLEQYDQRVLAQLRSARVDLVILAGYNKILSRVL